MNPPEPTSTRPYLLRALYEWCVDNGFAPYIAVLVDDTVQVPRDYVKDGEIILNISYDATSSLKLGNEFIEFKARFAGVAREIIVPVNRVLAIYARENGQGMAFPVAPNAQPHPIAPAAAPAAPAATALSRVPVLAAAPDGTAAEGPEAGVPLPPASGADGDEPPRPPAGPRPALKRVK